MKGHHHGRSRRLAGLGIAAGLALSMLPGAVTGSDPLDLPRCASFAPATDDDETIIEPWRVLLDADGAVVGHRMRFLQDGRERTIRTGRRGFAVRIRAGRTLIGERAETGTRLNMIDTSRGCIAWTRSLSTAAYVTPDSDPGELRMTLHDPGSRSYQGTLVLDQETGATAAMIDEECNAACVPNDGEVPPAAFGPAGYARPVPRFAAGGWAKDKKLKFRWASGDVPPTWAKGPLKSGAADASDTSRSRSPLFIYGSGASNAVHYSGALPGFCGAAIACAGRNKAASWWGVWIKPHGSDFAWGTLRWCQKKQSTGCFDIRRVMLHELGHIVGLNHPESEGFKLGPHETVMHSITPAKPKAGSTRHAFGRCDVATLQELYDVPVHKTPISSCNDVVTKISLVATAAAIDGGDSVKFKARLRIANRSSYGQLADNPLNKRSVKLKHRRLHSTDAWTTSWMRFDASGRYDLAITPSRSLEFKATFPEPSDEGLRFSRSDLVEVRVR